MTYCLALNSIILKTLTEPIFFVKHFFKVSTNIILFYSTIYHLYDLIKHYCNNWPLFTLNRLFYRTIEYIISVNIQLNCRH